MSTDGKSRERPLFPFQQSFVESFIKSFGPGRVDLLIAPTGTGKSRTAAELVSRLTESTAVERILVLAPARVLVQQWTYEMASRGIQSTDLDASTYRLLRESTGSEGVLPTGAYSTTIQFAVRGEVANYLARTPWNLVIVDEAHALAGGKLGALLDVIHSNRAAVLLMTATPNRTLIDIGVRGTITDWRDEWVSALATSVAPVRTTVVEYSRTADEVELLSRILRAARTISGHLGGALLRRAGSSVNALEIALNRASNSEALASDTRHEFGELLQHLEDLTVDSQLDTALRLLREHQFKHAVLFCDYIDTANYLVASLSEAGHRCWSSHADLAPGDRANNFEAFQGGGGILVSTSAGATALTLNFVDRVIHYDVPAGVAQFVQRRGRFNRLGRSIPCDEYIMVDASELFPAHRKLHRLIRDAVTESSWWPAYAEADNAEDADL